MNHVSLIRVELAEQKSTMADEIYSEEDKSAFMRVGEFLNWFSQLELKMDEAIIRILGIEEVAGHLLLSYISCRSKCEFLKKLSKLPELELSENEQNQAKEITSKIQALHDHRNVLAHSYFRADSEGVRFLKAEKKLEADTSRTYSEDKFIGYRNEMVDLWGRLAQLSHRIETKIAERRNETIKAMLRARFSEMMEPVQKPH